MPCRHYSDEEERSLAEEQARKYKEKLDNVTRLLCGVMSMTKDGNHRSQNEFLYGVPGLREWWEQHQKDDEKREKQKKAHNLLAQKRKVNRTRRKLNRSL